MTTIPLPITCEYHEVHAVVQPVSKGLVTVQAVVALYCSDCNEQYAAE